MATLLNIWVVGRTTESELIDFPLPRAPEHQTCVLGLINQNDQFVEMWPKVRVGVQELVPEC